MNYERKYKEALSWMQSLYDGLHGVTKEDAEHYFPELKESEDERKRKAILTGLIDCRDAPDLGWSNFGGINIDECIAWLEKQRETDKSLYIRFGNIPTNGKSKVYNGEIEIGIEEGISVYPAFEDKEGNIILGLNLPITKTSLHTQQHLLEYESRPCYLVTGDYVGKGTDGEPLLKNIRIMKEIKPYRIKQDKENNTYIINNTPNCGISVSYNEELKESENDKIRKGILELIRQSSEILDKQNQNDMIAWLEKQGWLEKQCEQPIDKVEPKFKVGDWVVNSTTLNLCHILKVEHGQYICDDCSFPITHENEYHLWTIQDAKAGDVLANDHNILILKELDYDWSSNGTPNAVKAYCGIKPNGNFELGKDNWCFCGTLHIHPATKEQCDLLFAKMKETGYEWDGEKKELKNIEVASKESEDERIKETLIDYFKTYKEQEECGINTFFGIPTDNVLAWLEKQREQSADVEPKFHEGEWLQYRNAKPFFVEEITKQGYVNGISCLPFEWEDEIHLWTIRDAKDGDVLATEDGRPFIIRCMVESKNDIPSAYCGINARPIEAFIITGYSPGTSKWTNSKVHPATKEQRDLLFQKMKEAGYEWNAEKKELRKIDAHQLSEDPCSDCTNTKGCVTCVNGDQKSTSATRILYSDEVIKWLRQHTCTACFDKPDEAISLRINKFKEDFDL